MTQVESTLTNKQTMLEQIRKVRSLNLRKFLVFFCLREDHPIGIKTRRAIYDYRLSKKLILDYMNTETNEADLETVFLE